MSTPHRLIFGAFALDLHDERLWRAANVIHLHPKAFAVLRCLLIRAGQLVTKDALFATVWPDTVVSEAVLATAIRELRRALEDRAHTPQYIETVYGRGYRFIASVRMAESTTASPIADLPAQQVSPTALVGRESELAEIQQWLVAALQGKRQIGCITGEAGIGKTALVDTFMDHVAATSDLWVSRGQCIEQYGAGEPYLPLLEALGRLCRDADGAHLVDLFRQYAPSWLGQMPSFLTSNEREKFERQGSAMTRERMLRELAEVLEVLTAEQPLLLVLEDLHWSDVSTLEWLSYVARRRETARVLILGTYRPVDVIVHRHPLRQVLTELRQHGQCVERVLDYLSEGAVATYLTQRFGTRGVPDGLSQVLHQRTNGNPFFLVTMVDEMIRQGVLLHQGAGWVFRGTLESVSVGVPENVRHLIETQLEQLSVEDQEMLAAASVAGSEFAAVAVATALAEEIEEVESRCEALARRGQFLRPIGVAEWPDRTVVARYRFMHDVYHEVVHERIPPSRRVRWHQQIGTRMEAAYGTRAQEIAPELAMHFVQSGDSAKALFYLVQSGERAMRVYANADALRAFQQAMEILKRLPVSETTDRQRTELTIRLATLHMLLGHYSESLTHYGQALEAAQVAGDTQAVAQLESRLGRVHYSMGNYQEARSVLERALARAQHNLDYTRMAICYQSLGDVHFSSGTLGQAITCYMSALRIAEETDDLSGVAAACTFLSNAHMRAGNLAEAITWGRRALELGERLCDDRRMAWACLMLHCTYRSAGDFPEASSLLDQALQLCDKVGDFRGLAWVKGHHGLLQAAAVKDFVSAFKAAKGVIDMGQNSGGFQHEVSYVSARAAEALLRLGRYHEASAYCQKGLAISLKTANKLEYGYAYMVLAEIHAAPASRDWAKAAWYLEESLKAFRQVGAQIDVGRAHLAGARIAQQRQDNSARQWATTARDIFAERGAQALLKEAEALFEASCEDIRL